MEKETDRSVLPDLQEPVIPVGDSAHTSAQQNLPDVLDSSELFHNESRVENVVLAAASEPSSPMELQERVPSSRDIMDVSAPNSNNSNKEAVIAGDQQSKSTTPEETLKDSLVSEVSATDKSFRGSFSAVETQNAKEELLLDIQLDELEPATKNAQEVTVSKKSASRTSRTSRTTNPPVLKSATPVVVLNLNNT